MKRSFLLVLLSVFLVSGLLYAGGAQEESIDVEIWVHQYNALNTWLQAKAEAYNAENEGVNVIIQPFPSGDLPEKVYTATKSGSGPAAFDFLCLNYESLIDKDIIAPVDYKSMGYDSADAFASEWYEGSIKGLLEVDGEYYGLPYTANTWSLFINKEHMLNAGLDPETDYPKTWEDLKELARLLTIRDDNGKLVQKGFDLPFSQADHWWFWTWGPILPQLGSNILSEDGSVATINGPEGVESLQILYDLVHTYGVTDAGTAVNEAEEFKDGKTSMWISGVWSYGTFKGREIEDKYMAVPLPQIDPDNRLTLLGGYWWHVSNKVDAYVQEEAWKFLEYITCDAGEQFKETGLLMPKPSVLASEAWKAYPYNEVFAIDLAAGIWPQTSPIYPEIEDAVAEAMERSLIGDMTPQEAMDIAAKQINTAIEEHVAGE